MILCFDLWNTLLMTSSEFSYTRKLIEFGAVADQIYPFVRDTLMTGRYTSYEQMVEVIFDHFRIVCGDRQKSEVAKEWRLENESAVWVPGVLKLLEELGNIYASDVLITNTTAPAWQEVNRRLKVRDKFTLVYLSFAHAAAKPDRRVWEIVESWFPKVSPNRFWMIGDNSIDDLQVSAQRGWQTVLVTDGDLTPVRSGPCRNI